MAKTIIPLTVSAAQAAFGDAASVEVTPYANATGTTTEKAPVLLAVKSTAQLDAAQFAALLPKVGGQGTQAQARLALNAVAAVLGDLVEEYGAITVQTPFGTVQTFIAGTLENAQDAPDPEANQPFLGVVVPEAYRRQFAQIKTYVPSEACPAALKRVRDKATNAKGICGTDPFYLEGRGMTIGGGGETLELVDATTREKLCDISADAESKSPVQFLCTLAPQTALEAGTYLVRLTTRAGVSDGPLWPVDLKVELLEAVTPPVPEPLVTSADGFVKVMSIDENPVPALGDFTVRGENVGYKSGDPDHGLMGALATIAGKSLSWHCTAYDDDRAPEATFASDGSEDELPPGEYIAALTLNYAVDDGTGVSHLEPLVIEGVRFKVGE